MTRFFTSLILALALAVPVVGSAWAQASGQASASGLALPRFVSIRAEEANLRTGPGIQYPVEWVYKRAGLPLEVIAEYKTWRKVRDWEGAQGWVHQSMVASKRAFIVIGGSKNILNQPDPASAPVARAQEGLVGEILACPIQSQWCRVNAEGFEGWMQRRDFWGVLDGETFD